MRQLIIMFGMLLAGFWGASVGVAHAQGSGNAAIGEFAVPFYNASLCLNVNRTMAGGVRTVRAVNRCNARIVGLACYRIVSENDTYSDTGWYCNLHNAYNAGEARAISRGGFYHSRGFKGTGCALGHDVCIQVLRSIARRVQEKPGTDPEVSAHAVRRALGLIN